MVRVKAKVCPVLVIHNSTCAYRIFNIWVAMVIFEQHFHHIQMAMLNSIVHWRFAQLQMVKEVDNRSCE